LLNGTVWLTDAFGFVGPLWALGPLPESQILATIQPHITCFVATAAVYFTCVLLWCVLCRTILECFQTRTQLTNFFVVSTLYIEVRPLESPVDYRHSTGRVSLLSKFWLRGRLIVIALLGPATDVLSSSNCLIEMEDAAKYIERVNIPNSLRTIGPFLEEAQSLLRYYRLTLREVVPIKESGEFS
jgi:hypothetical protein